MGNSVSKQERFEEFCRRLEGEQHARTFGEAYEQIRSILNQVEDELTTIPFNPDNWQTDGRLYPPQPDSMREVEGHPEVRRFRSRGHNTFVGVNGSIEIQ